MLFAQPQHGQFANKQSLSRRVHISTSHPEMLYRQLSVSREWNIHQVLFSPVLHSKLTCGRMGKNSLVTSCYSLSRAFVLLAAAFLDLLHSSPVPSALFNFLVTSGRTSGMVNHV